MDPPVGALVEVSAGRGIVRFAGATSFSSGKWIGIELHEPKGKNDGSLQGLTYFSCKPNHGVFVRPSQVKVINAEPEPQPPVSPYNCFAKATLNWRVSIENTGRSDSHGSPTHT
jgi:dynactin 1